MPRRSSRTEVTTTSGLFRCSTVRRSGMCGSSRDSTERQQNLEEKPVSTEENAAENKALVLEAFDSLFNRRDYARAETYWSAHYIQHSAHIPPGRDGLFDLIRALPATLRYENALTAVDGDFVILHGRFSGHGRPRSWIAADVVRMEGDRLAEHWDVLQDEATKKESRSGVPMFGTSFGGTQSADLTRCRRHAADDRGRTSHRGATL